jgi:hypothetical protein
MLIDQAKLLTLEDFRRHASALRPETRMVIDGELYDTGSLSPDCPRSSQQSGANPGFSGINRTVASSVSSGVPSSSACRSRMKAVISFRPSSCAAAHFAEHWRSRQRSHRPLRAALT